MMAKALHRAGGGCLAASVAAQRDVRSGGFVGQVQSKSGSKNRRVRVLREVVPRILELRRLHEAMDRAVLDAYGWSNVAVPSYCPKNDEERAQIAAFEDEVIDRLYVLNAERAAEEKRAGAGAAGKRRGAEDGGRKFGD